MAKSNVKYIRAQGWVCPICRYGVINENFFQYWHIDCHKQAHAIENKQQLFAAQKFQWRYVIPRLLYRLRRAYLAF